MTGKFSQARQQRDPLLYGLTWGGLNRIKFQVLGPWAWTPISHLRAPWWEPYPEHEPGGSYRRVPMCSGSPKANGCEICERAKAQYREWLSLLPVRPNQRRCKATWWQEQKGKGR